MLSQIRLTLRPNNQITIGKQNCPMAFAVPYKSLELTNADYGSREKDRLQRILHRLESERSPKYDWQGNLIPRRIRRRLRIVLLPKLDLIQKFQQGFKAIRSLALLVKLSDLTIATCEYFGQFRLNPRREFGKIAGQRIREAGAAMDIVSGSNPRFCHVTTLTLPANTRESFECLAAYSSYIVNRLFQIIRRRYKDLDYWFFVWEFQKRGALHLHIAHYHPDESEGMMIGNMLIEQWHKILCDISDNSGIWMLSDKCIGDYGIKNFYQYHTQPMYKSVGGYFSKYAGKASQSEENSYVREHAKLLSPKRYWGSSFSLKDIIKENSHTSLIELPNQMELDARYNSIIDMILEYEIVYYSEYSFRKDIEKEDVRNGKVYQRTIAEGERQTFYLNPSDYQAILIRLREFDEYF